MTAAHWSSITSTWLKIISTRRVSKMFRPPCEYALAAEIVDRPSGSMVPC